MRAVPACGHRLLRTVGCVVKGTFVLVFPIGRAVLCLGYVRQGHPLPTVRRTRRVTTSCRFVVVDRAFVLQVPGGGFRRSN